MFGLPERQCACKYSAGYSAGIAYWCLSGCGYRALRVSFPCGKAEACWLIIRYIVTALFQIGSSVKFTMLILFLQEILEISSFHLPVLAKFIFWLLKYGMFLSILFPAVIWIWKIQNCFKEKKAATERNGNKVLPFWISINNRNLADIKNQSAYWVLSI